LAVYVLRPIEVDVERARAAVAARGSVRQQARLAGVLGAPAPDRGVVAELERLQNADGGFPEGDEPGAPSSVGATCRVLAQLRQMPPLAGSPMASRAVSYLRRCQEFDGSWRLGREEIALTAWAAYTICIQDPTHTDPPSRASAWLRRRLSQGDAAAELPSRVLAMVWALGVALHGQADPEARRVFGILDRREMAASDLALWLLLAMEVGAGGAYLLPLARRLGELAALQQPDGLWPAAGGDPVETTLTALWAFRLSGLIQEGESGGGVGSGRAEGTGGPG